MPIAETVLSRTTKETFRILFVCTGNICRSPLAEHLMREQFDELQPGTFKYASAGTRALAGAPMDDRASEAAQRLNINTSNFRARQLTSEMLSDADLILTSAREHRAFAAELNPLCLRRTFTIREFARVLPSVEIDHRLSTTVRWTTAVSKASRARSSLGSNKGDDDIIDPYRRSDSVYAQMLSELTPAIQIVTNWEQRMR